MRGWLGAFDEIAELFDEVEIWATRCSLTDHPKVTWVPFRDVKPWVLRALAFKLDVKRRVKQQAVWPPEDTVVQVTGFALLQADIRFIHYCNILFGEEVEKRPETLSLSWIRMILLKRAIKEERPVRPLSRTCLSSLIARFNKIILIQLRLRVSGLFSTSSPKRILQ